MKSDKASINQSASEPTTDSRSSDLAAGLSVTWLGFWINNVLVVLKIVVGYLVTSQALIADGVHSLTDAISDLVVVVGLRWGRAEADYNHPYGHGRIETLASMIVGILLISVAIGIGYGAVNSLITPTTISSPLAAVVVAALGIVIKEALYRYTLVVGQRIHSQAVIANAWDHRSDALTSVVVLVGVAVVWLVPSWNRADAIAAIIVGFFVAKIGIELTWQAVKEVIDTAPSEDVIADITRLAESVDGVFNAHDVKARYSGASLLAEIHIVVDPEQSVRSGHDIANAVERLLVEKVERLDSVIVHVDPVRDSTR